MKVRRCLYFVFIPVVIVIMLLILTKGISFSLYPFYDGVKWGYMNKQGQIIISPKYDSVGIFSEGLAPVLIINNDQPSYGYINKRGTIVIKSKYYSANNFINGYAKVSIRKDKNEQVVDAYINKKGVISTPPKSYFLKQSNNLEVYLDKSTNKWGYKDLKGRVKILPMFDKALAFKNGFAIVFNKQAGSNGGLGYINTKGKELTKYAYSYVENFSEGMGLVRNREGLYGFIDETGKLVINCKYRLATSFHEGTAAVVEDEQNKKEHEYFINRQDKMVLDLGVRSANKENEIFATVDDVGFYKGLALLRIRNFNGNYLGKLTYIDKNGKLIYPKQYKLTYSSLNEFLATIK